MALEITDMAKRVRGEESNVKNQLSNDFREAVEQSLSEFVERTVRRLFDERRELWITGVEHLIRRSLGGQLNMMQAAESNARESVVDESWIPIASLSQLRKEVGGRFQNLRTRWTESGFPLKAHKGIDFEEYELSQSGWREMVSWLLKQGYESRLLGADDEGYFAIRKRG